MSADADRDWRQRGTCATGPYPPDLWFSSAAGDRAAAVHVCRIHCPVYRRFCRPEAKRNPTPGGVYGGIVWNERKSGKDVMHVRPADSCALCSFRAAEALAERLRRDPTWGGDE